MQIFDSHCHLVHEPLFSNVSDILHDCQKHGDYFALLPSTCAAEFSLVAQLITQHSNLIPAFGFHPFFVDDIQSHDWDLLADFLNTVPNSVVGEIGLDFYKPSTPEHQINQLVAFEKQLILCQELKRPMTLHVRKATQVCFEILDKYAVTGFMHAFSGSLEEAKYWIQKGFLLGIGSVLLNPNAKKIRHVIEKVDLEHMVLETDAPYMKPCDAIEDFNHPENIILIAKIVANIKNIPLATVLDTCAQNTWRMLTRS